MAKRQFVAAMLAAMVKANRTAGPSPEIENPFAAFERRFVAILIEFLGLFILTAIVQGYVFELIDLTATDTRPVFFAIATLYFSLSWWGPLSATPVQFLLRIRVVDTQGERLSFGHAVLRSALLIVSIIAAMTLFQAPYNPYYLIIAIPAFAVMFLAALTPNRQAGHDFLARSLVVVKGAVISPEDRGKLREYLANTGSNSRRSRKPTVLRIIGSVIAVGIPVFLIFNVALMQFDRSLRARIQYAWYETSDIRHALREVYLDERRWGTTENDLGFPIRLDYPDGGYYELEENGVIRIRFTVIPTLRKFSLVLSPTWKEDQLELEWECRAEGEVKQAILPSHCRDGI